MNKYPDTMTRKNVGILAVTLVSFLVAQSCGRTDSSLSGDTAVTLPPNGTDTTNLPNETNRSATTPVSTSIVDQQTSSSVNETLAGSTTIQSRPEKAHSQPTSTISKTTTLGPAPTTSFTSSGSPYDGAPDEPFECTIAIIAAPTTSGGARQFDLRIESTSVQGTAYVRVSWENDHRNHLIPLSLGGVGMTRVTAGMQGQVEAVVFSAADFRPSSERCSALAS